MFFPGVLVLNFINSSWTFACSYLFERSNRCEHAKGNMQKTGNFHLKKTEKNNKIYAITLRLQVIQIYSHQSLKYNWIDFSSKQRSFYFTKSSRGPDPTMQRAGFGPRAVCLTPLICIIIYIDVLMMVVIVTVCRYFQHMFSNVLWAWLMMRLR